MSDDALVCPGCARSHPAEERFCRACGMPLVSVLGGELHADRRQQRARKIKPQYSEGALVKVARGENQPEAEFLEGLLLEEGIPSILRLAGGTGAYLVAGARDVLVPESAAQAAREALGWERP